MMKTTVKAKMTDLGDGQFGLRNILVCLDSIHLREMHSSPMSADFLLSLLYISLCISVWKYNKIF